MTSKIAPNDVLIKFIYERGNGAYFLAVERTDARTVLNDEYARFEDARAAARTLAKAGGGRVWDATLRNQNLWRIEK